MYIGGETGCEDVVRLVAGAHIPEEDQVQRGRRQEARGRFCFLSTVGRCNHPAHTRQQEVITLFPTCCSALSFLAYLLTSQRYLLLLDSIRQCEGVAKLLQNSTGKEVAVKPAKTNKVTPGELPQEDNSPVTQILEAIPPELYVTNHKKWLSLRVGGGGGGGGMGLPFCC